MFYELNNKRKIIKYLSYIADQIEIIIQNFFSMMYRKINSSKILSYVYRFIVVIALSLTVIISSVKLTLAFKPLYYYDIYNLNIEESSNLSIDEMKLNYNYLIDYLSTDGYEFNLPTLPSSDNGKIHFKEVKVIFLVLNKTLFFSMLISIVTLITEIRDRKFYFLKWTSIALFAIPLILLTPLAINFDKSFTAFHKFMFNNNYWLLNRKTDPVINMLPQPFFFHCAIMILGTIFLSSFIMIFIYKKQSKYSKT